MPVDAKRYPVDWKQISQRIRFERAGGKCETCGAPHGKYIIRIPGTSDWLEDTIVDGYYAPDGTHIKFSEVPAGYDVDRPVKVVLTVHHIGINKPDGTPGDIHDKMDCRDENLVALCARCHLIADLPGHIQNAKQTRLKKKHAGIRAAGQRVMFEDL